MMLYIFTGNGKGKTTAALGQAMRAAGEGKRVLMVQFIKGPWKSGEHLFVEAFQIPQSRLQIKRMGRGFVGILGDTLPIGEHARAAEEALEYARKEVAAGKWDILILDEVHNAVSLGLISKASVLTFVEAIRDKLNAVILTGRDAPQEFIDRADLVTEMKDRKHPYEKGVRGKRGLEY